MDSKIAAFYKNKTVFITGGTGFLGSLLIEKLLRTTEVKRIYMLVRPKRGVEIQNRLNGLKDNLVYSVLMKQNANFMDRIVAIAGDCCLPDLGISESNRRKLTDEVHIVLHSAATVNFDEALNIALKINTRATRILLQLAKKMRRLEAYVHISTAYSNCVLDHVDETFYPGILTSTADKVLTLTEHLSDKLIDSMTPALLGDFPNTYTFTKALSEQLVQMESEGLPTCVFRPGMILPAYKEPVEGWIDNLYGPISVLYGCAMGVLRVMTLNRKARSNIVPVDFCVNLILASAWKTSVDTQQRKEKANTKALTAPPIYNFVPTQENRLTWGQFSDLIQNQRPLIPFANMIWYPYLITPTTLWTFHLLITIYHQLPGLIIDTILRIRGERPRMTKMYKKIHHNLQRLGPFSIKNWTFEMTNSERLLQCMSPQDKAIYDFDINKLNWDDYWPVALMGVREYVGKESRSTAERGKKLLKRLFIYNLLAHFIGICIFAGILYLLISPIFRLF